MAKPALTLLCALASVSCGNVPHTCRDAGWVDFVLRDLPYAQRTHYTCRTNDDGSITLRFPDGSGNVQSRTAALPFTVEALRRTPRS